MDPWLGNNAKTWLYHCETLNTWLKNQSDVDFVPLWIDVASILQIAFTYPNFQSISHVQHILKCLLCLSFGIVDFHHFWHIQLIYLTTVIFVLAAITNPSKLYYTIFHYYKWPVVHGVMGCNQKTFKLVWQCHQLLSGFLAYIATCPEYHIIR